MAQNYPNQLPSQWRDVEFQAQVVASSPPVSHAEVAPPDPTVANHPSQLPPPKPTAYVNQGPVSHAAPPRKG